MDILYKYMTWRIMCFLKVVHTIFLLDDVMAVKNE